MPHTILPHPEERFAEARLEGRGADLPLSTANVSKKLYLRTLGHASLALFREGENPILLTDPWLVGSVYWRSWWLQHYPSDEEIDWAAKSAFIYVTHEHPDHFHMPSIRRLGHLPSYLFPALAERGYLEHMTQLGYHAEILAPLRWRS